MKSELTIRFRDFPQDQSRITFVNLMELCFKKSFKPIEDSTTFVDVEITGPYSGLSDSFKTPIRLRAARALYTKLSRGKHLSIPSLAAGVTPSKRGKYNIWYTGENQRPPYGNWDAYLSFDTKFAKEKNFYLPLWLLTSTDFVQKIDTSYWGRANPTLEELKSRRQLHKTKKKIYIAGCGGMLGEAFYQKFKHDYNFCFTS